jgi:DNA-binding MarR family transcriptional regulator
MHAAGGTGPFELQHHVFYWMTQVMNARDRQINSELRPHRIRVPEWRILALLKARQSLSIGETAATIGLDHATMSRTVDRMARAGHILRLSDTADLRVTRLSLTAAGIKLFDEVWPIVARLNQEALVRLPDGATSLLCMALAEIQRAMDETWRRAKDKVKRKHPDADVARG